MSTPEPPALHSLRPAYDVDEHGVYVKRIVTAVKDTSATAPLNIAISGTYGSGKSSVVEGLRRQLDGDTLLVVSIPSFRRRERTDATANADARAELEREVVKQLLYRRSGKDLQGSRLRKLTVFDPRQSWTLALILATFTLAISLLAGGWNQLAAAGLGFAAAAGTAVALAAILTVGFFTLLRASHNRVSIRGLQAGPASVTLGDGSSAIDQNLDEIIHFFETTTTRVVVFEDLDRFDNVEIFEELRELNTLINGTLPDDDRVVFIYSLRESVFDTTGTADASAAELRAKFFDLIVPVVAFATTRSGVDIWKTVVGPAAPSLRPEAVAVFAHHVRDMRLVKSIRNEFLVHKDVMALNRFANIDDTSLVALLVIKALDPRDFESIRTGESSLDRAERWRRQRLDEVLNGLDDLLRDDEVRRTSAREPVAATLGARLDGALRRSLRLARRSTASIAVKVDDGTFEDLSAVDLWVAIARGSDVELVSAGVSVEITQDDLLEMVGTMPPAFTASGALDGEHRAALVAERGRLRTAQLKDLLAFESQGSRGIASGLEQFTSLDLSTLVRDLIEAGAVDANFSLYVTRFFGQSISVDAMNFVLHVVRPGAPSYASPLPTPQDVHDVIEEVGTAFLGTSSALNLDLVHHLIDDEQLEETLPVIRSGTTESTGFLKAMAQRPETLRRLLSRLAPGWSEAWEIVMDLPLSDVELVSCIDAVLAASDATDYVPHPALKTFVEDHWDDFEFHQPTFHVTSGEAVARQLGSHGIEVPDLAAITDPLRAAVIEAGVFALDAHNLRELLGDRWTHFDALIEVSPKKADWAARNWADVERGLPARAPIVGSAQIDATVAFVADRAGGPGFSAFTARLPASAQVEDLRAVREDAWSFLMSRKLVALRLMNVLRYFDAHQLDDPLVRALSSRAEVTEASEAEAPIRVRFAQKILADRRIAPTKRVRIVHSLDLPDYLELASIASTEPLIVKTLLARDLIADSAANFELLNTKPWPVQRAYVQQSKTVRTWIHEAKFSGRRLADFFEDEHLSIGLRAEVGAAAARLTTSLGPRSAQMLARFAVRHGVRLPDDSLDLIATSGCPLVDLAALIDAMNLSNDRAVALVAMMPGRERRIAERGHGFISVPDQAPIRALLTRLEGAGIVSSWPLDKKGKRRVYRYH